MKETNVMPIPMSEIVVDGLYLNKISELMQVKSIDRDKNEMTLYSISEQYTQYFVKYENCNLIKRIR